MTPTVLTAISYESGRPRPASRPDSLTQPYEFGVCSPPERSSRGYNQYLPA
ncbi:MAG: hypothetical protein JWM61_1310, partial [Micrococcaceae bacterium]|nr:hypothetical protein [Micrococcaceae bacterium]